MIEAIVFIVLWIVSTEIIYFGFLIGRMSSFFIEKYFSILGGALAVLFLFGFPFAAAYGPDGYGYIAYVWYYSVAGSIVAFLGINYLITKGLEKRGKK